MSVVNNLKGAVKQQNNLRASKKTILVLEDELCCAMSLELLLQSFGCEVLLASACEEGLSLLREKQHCIDLILLDIMMPGRTGIDFLDDARGEDILADIPVVIQSAEGKDTISKALEKGACGYIHKPHVKAEILSLVTNLIKSESFSHCSEERICA